MKRKHYVVEIRTVALEVADQFDVRQYPGPGLYWNEKSTGIFIVYESPHGAGEKSLAVTYLGVQDLPEEIFTPYDPPEYVDPPPPPPAPRTSYEAYHATGRPASPITARELTEALAVALHRDAAVRFVKGRGE